MMEFTIFGQQVSALELAGVITGITGVWLTMKENIFCFPVGIINVSIYAWIFFSPGIRLYADALLQCVFILLLIYGWIKWAGRNNQNVLVPVRINSSIAFKLAAITILSTILLSFLLVKFTNASYPLLDSSLACASLAAQWMIARKFIENWIVWIIANLVYIPLYISKQLPFTAVLYFIFMVLAVKGFCEWKKQLRHAV